MVIATATRRRQPTRFSEGGGARIPGVEIFRSGMHRGKPYSEDDIKEMVRNFHRYSKEGAKPGLSVPAVLGHEESQEWLERSDLPAAGWAKKLGYERQTCPICKGSGTVDGKPCPDCNRAGTVLVAKADFGDIPRKVKRLIDGRQYKTVSAEVYDKIPDGLPDAGKESKMLRRVAFLGGEIPQIKSLEDIPVTQDMSETQPKYERVNLRCQDGVCDNANGTYTVFYETYCGDRPRKFCQTGENKGKHGPCPEGNGGGTAGGAGAGKPLGLAAQAAASKPQERKSSRREETKRRPIVEQAHKSINESAKTLGPEKTHEITQNVGKRIAGAVKKLGAEVAKVVKNPELQHAVVATIISDGHSWANSTALQDALHSPLAPSTLLGAGSRIAAYATVKALKHLTALGLFDEVEMADEDIMRVAPIAREFLRSLHTASGVTKPIPSDGVLAKRLREQLRKGSGEPERFSQTKQKKESAMNREEMLKKLMDAGYSEDELKDATDELLAAMMRHEGEEGEVTEEEEPTGDMDTGETDAGPMDMAEGDDEDMEGDEDEGPGLEDMADEDIDAMHPEEMAEMLKKHRSKMAEMYDEGGPGASSRTEARVTEPNDMPADMSPPKYGDKGGKKNVVKYSELRDSLVADIMAAVQPQLVSAVSKAQKTVQKFSERNHQTEKRASLQKFCEQQAKEGKIEPHRLQRGKQGQPSIVDTLMATDDSQPVYQFSDSKGRKKQMTALDMAMDEIRNRTPFKFGERIAVGGRPAGGNVAANADKKRHIAQLCEKFSEQLEKQGTSGAEFAAIMDNPKIRQQDKDAMIADLERAAGLAVA